MTPHIDSDTATSTNGRDNLPERAPAQQNKMAKSGYQEYRPKETRYNRMIYGERKLKRPREERKLVPVVKQEKVYRPEIGFRKIERCYLMPMGLDYKVPPYEMKYYKPLPHQPTYTQRQLRPLRATPYKPYQTRQYRLTENNYGYGLLYVSQPTSEAERKAETPEKMHGEDDAHSSTKEDVQNTGNVVPVGGVAVLPPVLGATPKPKPEPKPRVERKEKSTSSMWIGSFPMPKRFDGNGMYIVRDYRYTPRNFRYDKHPRYREYKNQKPLPFREYNHELVYVGHQSAGHRIQKRQFERAPVKHAPPVQQPKAAPVPIIAPVVIPAAAGAAKTPPPAKEEEPVPEDPQEEPPSQEEPQEKPDKEPEENPRPQVVAAAAVIEEPSKEVVKEPVAKEATPEPEPAPAQKTPKEASPEPHSGVIAGAALGGAALGGAVAATAVAATNNSKPPTPAPRKTTPTPQPAVQPESSNQSVPVSAPVAAAVTGAIAGAAVGAAASANTNTTDQPKATEPQAPPSEPQPAPAPPPQPVVPEPQAPIVAAAAAPVAAAAAPQAANPPAQQAAPQATAPTAAAAPAAPPQATQATGTSGTLGCIQRSLEIFG